MRHLYNLLTYLLLIPFAIYWFVKGIGNRSYFDRLGQRFGFGFPQFDSCIWIHAVSVGEVQAAAPLLQTLKQRFPDQTLLVTTVTPTGAAHAKKLFGDAVEHCYMPFEFPNAIRSFFATVRPKTAMIMETEIWPNLFRGCGVRNIPLVLVSARISPRSIPGYRRLLPLIRETLSHGIIIAAQSQADADRFLELGASPERTWVTGNIKFDVAQDSAIAERGRELRNTMFGQRPVWIAASTHEGEEELVLQAHAELIKHDPDLLLLLVPRHPQRFEGVRELIEKQSLNVVSRSEDKACDESTTVFLLDTMGELKQFYACSDIAFVAGSLVPIGGHNLLEPAALGLPIITGPHMHNALDIAAKFTEVGACKVVANGDELVPAVGALLGNAAEAQQMGEKALQVLEQNRGALARLLQLLEPLLVKQKS